MKKNLFTILILTATLSMGLFGCGDSPLTEAYNYIPNRAPVIESLVITDYLGNDLIANPADYLASNNEISITMTAHDPEGKPLNVKITSDFGGISDESTIDGTTTATLTTNSNVTPDMPVSIIIELTDSAGMLTSRVQVLGTGNSGLQVTETSASNQSPYTHSYNFATPVAADERSFEFTSKIPGIYQIRTDEPVFNRHEAVYLYYPEQGDTINISVNNSENPLGSEGAHDFYIIFRDTIGNEAAFTKTVVADDTSPEAGSIAFPGDYTNSTTPEITIAAELNEETESPITHMWLSNDPSVFTDGTPADWVDFSTSKSDWAIESATNGLKTVYALFKDGSENITPGASPVSGSITYDTTKPTGDINIFFNTTNDPSITIIPDADADASGVAEVAFSETSSPSSYIWRTLPSAGGALSYSIQDFTEGIKTVYVFFRDGAGNITDSPGNDTVTVDMTPPDNITSVTTDPYNHRIVFNWTNPSDANRVIIYRKANSIPASSGDGKKIFSNLNTECTDSGDDLPAGELDNSTQYGYLAFVLDEAGNISSGYGFLAQPANHSPNEPVNYSLLNQTDIEAKLNWEAAAEPDPDGDTIYYRISASADGSTTYTIISTTTNTTRAITKANLESVLGSAGLYSLIVSAIDTEGASSTATDPIMVTFADTRIISKRGSYITGSPNFIKISHYSTSAFIIDSAHTTTKLRGFNISNKASPTPNTYNADAGFSVNYGVASNGSNVFLSGGKLTKGTNKVNQYSYNHLTMTSDGIFTFGSSESYGSALQIVSSYLCIGSNHGLFTYNILTQDVETIDLGGFDLYEYDIKDLSYDSTNLYAACQGSDGGKFWVNDGLYIISPGGKFGQTTPSIQRFRPMSNFYVKGVCNRDGLTYICVQTINAGASGLYVLSRSSTGTWVQVGFAYFTSSSGFEDIAVCGRYAFVALGTEGIQVIDIISPTNPVVHSTMTTLEAFDFSVSDDYLMVAAGSNGLMIYEIHSD